MLSVQDNQIKSGFRSPLVLTIVSLLLVVSFNVRADHKLNLDSDGEIISGYDTVAYFTMGKAVKGSKDIKVDWLGATWLFASKEHLDMFLTDPGKYIPQYGGYCAINAWFDRHSTVDPETWKIVDGKLYLFSDEETARNWDADFGSTRTANEKWEKAKTGFLQQ